MGKRRYIVTDSEKCTGCGICELACSGVKTGAFNPLSSRIRTVWVEPLFTTSIACQLCEDAKCVSSCPRKALKKDLDTGVIIVNDEDCDGCCWCLQACEFGAITFLMDKKKVAICDLCGSDPKCVLYCPKNALELRTPEEISLKLRKEAAKRFVTSSSK